MKLIGFNGQMGVGKSTAIKVLREQGKTCYLIKFAGPLYEIQEFIYDRIREVYQRPSTFVKDRKLLQWIGTEWGRGTIRDSLWVDLWKAETKYAQENYPGAIIVCDDVRFDNEAHTIKSIGGTVVQIVRDDSTKHADGGTGIINHASEAGISAALVDHTISNNGTLEDFTASLCELYKQLGVGQGENEAA